MSELIDGLAPNGRLLVVGATFDPIDVMPVQLIVGRSNDSRLQYGNTSRWRRHVGLRALTGVRPMIETYPLEQAGEAYARMMSGQARFRVVLTM